MARDKTLIISAAATLLIADKGETVADVGYTRGGVSITKSIDTREILADQVRHPLYQTVESERYEINFRLLQIDCANLKEGWGEADAVSGTTLKLGVYEENPVSKEIQLYSKRKDDKYVKFTFYDAVLSSTGAMAFTRDDEALIEATFTAMYDDDEECVGLMEVTESV